MIQGKGISVESGIGVTQRRRHDVEARVIRSDMSAGIHDIASAMPRSISSLGRCTSAPQ
jgi:hypothetical protein